MNGSSAHAIRKTRFQRFPLLRSFFAHKKVFPQSVICPSNSCKRDFFGRIWSEGTAAARKRYGHARFLCPHIVFRPPLLEAW